MNLGIALPNGGVNGTASLIRQIGLHAEAVGISSVWSYDRLLYATEPRQGYGRQNPWPDDFRYTMDPLDVLGYLAGITTNLRLGTSVINLPFYNPVQLARRLTTLDHLSDGRLIIGAGLGWSEDEYEASGVSFARRGKRADEFLTLMQKIWTEDKVAFSGEFYQLPESVFVMKPVKKPQTPLYLGMFSPGGLRRTGRFANGWNPSGLPLPKLKEMFGQIKQHAADAGRDPEALKVVLRVFVDIDEDGDANSPTYVGPQSKVAEEFAAAAEAGVDTLIASLRGPAGKTQADYDKYLQRMSLVQELAG